MENYYISRVVQGENFQLKLIGTIFSECGNITFLLKIEISHKIIRIRTIHVFSHH